MDQAFPNLTEEQKASIAAITAHVRLMGYPTNGWLGRRDSISEGPILRMDPALDFGDDYDITFLPTGTVSISCKARGGSRGSLQKLDVAGAMRELDREYREWKT